MTACADLWVAMRAVDFLEEFLGRVDLISEFLFLTLFYWVGRIGITITKIDNKRMKMPNWATPKRLVALALIFSFCRCLILPAEIEKILTE
jgi:hypothetical protein